MTVGGNTPNASACMASIFKSDTIRFLHAWSAAPMTVASIVPSGEALAREMTSGISPCHAPVLELGPGTGVFTRALLRCGVSETDLTLIEYLPDFAKALEIQFPKARVLNMDATRLDQLAVRKNASFGAVLSGLPLLSMSSQQVTDILSGAFANLRPGGGFVQFTYGLRCPISRKVLDDLGLNAVHQGRALVNLPPANVYRITRRDETAP